ncbi:hypothetical protein [Gillisia limnaea]
MINKIEADWFHIDIMDGIFFSNILFDACSLSHHVIKDIDLSG